MTAKLKNLTGAAGNIISFSASSAELFGGCQRRFWFAKVEGLAVQGDAGIPAAWGGGAHFALENYLIRGALPPEGLHTVAKSRTETEDVTVNQDILERVRPALDYLPLPGKGEVEAWLPENIIIWEDRELGLKMNLKGRIDWKGHAPRDWTIPTLEHYRGLVILDHKSKGSLSGPFGAKDEESLAHDRQLLLYAAAETILSGHPPQDVAGVHNNIQRRGGIKTKLVATILEADRIEEAWAKSQETAAQMAAIAQIRDQTCVPANTGYCNAFNTLCDFAARCKAYQSANNTPQGGLLSALRNLEKDQSNMSLWDAFKQKKTEPETEAAAPAPSTKPEEKGIQAPDAAPHDVTSRSQIEEVCETFREGIDPGDAAGWTLGDIESALATEGLHRDWRYNVGWLLTQDPEAVKYASQLALGEIERFAALAPDYALLAPLNQISDILSNEYRPAFRADIFAAVESDELFAKIVKLVDGDVLLAVRPKVNAKRAAMVDEVRARRGDGTPFDNVEEFRETLRSLWLKQRGGYEISDDDIHESLKTHGYAVARSKKRIATVRALLEASKAVQTVKVEQPPQTTPDVPPTKLEPSAAVQETPESDGTVGDTIPAIVAVDPIVMVLPDGPVPGRTQDEEVPATKPTILYVGCFTDGARPLHEMQLMKDAEAEVAAFTKGKADHWTLYKDFSDTGFRRLAAAISMLVARNGLPGGEWYYDPNRSIYRDVPLIETFQAADAKIVQRLG